MAFPAAAGAEEKRYPLLLYSILPGKQITMPADTDRLTSLSGNHYQR